MRKVWSLFWLIFFTLFAHSITYACVCELLPNPSAQQIRAAAAKEIDGATVIFLGEVIDRGEFEVRFKVERIWKGEVPREITLQTGARKEEDGTIIISTCDYEFQGGRRYLVYAAGANSKLQARKCEGTVEAKDALRQITLMEDILAEKQFKARRVLKDGPLTSKGKI